MITQEFKENMFRLITTKWQGSMMLFPIHKDGKHKVNIVIESKDIMDLIEKKIEEALK